MHLITSEQIRACRAILRWTIDDLAEKTGISVSTLKRIEKSDEYPNCRIANLKIIKSAFEKTNLVKIPNAETVVLIRDTEEV